MHVNVLFSICITKIVQNDSVRTETDFLLRPASLCSQSNQTWCKLAKIFEMHFSLTPVWSVSAYSDQKWHQRALTRSQCPRSVSQWTTSQMGNTFPELTAANLQWVVSEECLMCEGNHVCRSDMWCWKRIGLGDWSIFNFTLSRVNISGLPHRATLISV